MAELSVALLGLGTMGVGMAGNLLKAGFPLAVYNRTPARATPFAEQGARVSTTPADAAKGAQIIIAMLADDAASRETWTGENGALAAAEPGAVLVEASTLSPGWVGELATLASAKGLELLDAPHLSVSYSNARTRTGRVDLAVL